ncbi:MAG: amidophosphoribosyltransferase [Candidatus Glassbacteria bacterium GWA2_58_10]|uniref:Amidophosphoribosyltransferase n=1 Tax=Candidatus Glassbacteria bacterium GWA2_58_10 TaxID=1817865 RepID=A0A1F5YDS1_9BACT|nr:MAG: amidophosphoribosyltransferase [Candidatus Glassbacteria bacterium GWA2_58_10]
MTIPTPSDGCSARVPARDKPREYCGVFGAYNLPNAAELTYYGLYALQHRGQESAGIVSTDGDQLYIHRDTGLVVDIFHKPETLTSLKGSVAIGHNRYSTTGSSSRQNVQPLTSNFKDGFLAIGHNGNLVNTLRLRAELEEQGSIFQTSTDTEVILHLIARSTYRDPAEKIADALNQVKGAYCLVILINDELFAARDPRGYRPFTLGRLDEGWVVASETCALDLIGARVERDVEPGEILRIGRQGLQSYKPFPKKQLQQCVFELIYFSRPDSRIFGQSVDRVRRLFGRALAREHPAQGADIVISVPDSSNSAALGYAEESNIPLELGLIRNHYVGRTFIHPTQSIRDINTRIKYNPVRGVLEGKKVVVVDDSIVRGTTSRRLIRMIRQAGATEVHMRISSPPIRYPCYYGIDMPTRSELIGSSHTVDEIQTYLGVDSLGYLSEKGLDALGTLDAGNHCMACFNGNYAESFEKNFQKTMYEDIQPSLLVGEPPNP